MEIWCSLQSLGYNKYSVSSEGRILNSERNLILTWAQSEGYLRGSLTQHGVMSKLMVHHLLLLSFIGPPSENTYTVYYINIIHNDNVLCNLQWWSPSEQSTNRNTVSGRTRFVVLLKDSSIIHAWDVVVDAADYYGIIESAISKRYAGKEIYLLDINSNMLIR